MAKRKDPKIQTFACIKVVGIGGAGGSAINRMIESGVADVEFIAINTDAQALYYSQADVKLNIGPETTRGLGAGGDPKIGQEAAQESMAEIQEVLDGADMLFLALGAGGGTGSGAAHVIAKIAKDMGILVVAFVTKPFSFEIDKRSRNAEQAIANLEKNVDTLIIIPNDNLLNIIDTETPIQEAFRIADDVLRQGVQGIADLITVNGLINLDFADVRSIMQNAGQALMGIGRASGENRAETAAKQAINSPLLDISIHGAKGVLFNVIGGSDMTMHEINKAATVITDVADQDVNVIFGATIDPDLEGEMIITVIATGFEYPPYVVPGSDFRHINETNNLNDTEDIFVSPNKKIATADDLPSLPIKSKKVVESEEGTTEAAEEASEAEDEKPLEVEDLDEQDEQDEDPQTVITDDETMEAVGVDDLLQDIKEPVDDEATEADKKVETTVTSIVKDDEDIDIWDDVETDEDYKVDINKPTLLRKLIAKRRRNKDKQD